MSVSKFFLFLGLILAAVLTVGTLEPDLMRPAGICGLVALGVLTLVDLGRGGDKSAKSSRGRASMRAGR